MESKYNLPTGYFINQYLIIQGVYECLKLNLNEKWMELLQK